MVPAVFASLFPTSTSNLITVNKSKRDDDSAKMKNERGAFKCSRMRGGGGRKVY